jgi:hypothetical protein
VKEISGLARTLKQRREPILAWHSTGASNGPTEGLSSITKKIKRVAAGFTNFGTTEPGHCSPATAATETYSYPQPAKRGEPL